MHRFIMLLGLIAWGVFQASSFAQSLPLPTPSRFLSAQTTTAEVPEGLLIHRSALVIGAQPDAQGNLMPERTTAWAESFQAMFEEQGVDVVMVFRQLDLLSGREPWAAFEQLMVQRGIQYLIHLKENGDQSFTVSIANLPEQAPLLGASRAAYSLSAADVGTLVTDLRLEIIRADLSRENFMVLGTPEFFEDVPMITKNRYESFPLDLRLDKVAIRWPEDAGDDFKQQFGEYMDSLYPHEFGFVAATHTDQQIRNEGYQYTLDWVYATGYSVKTVFNYETKEGENTYITFMTLGPNEKDIKSIPIYTPVYKFYMRHLVTGDVYLGKEWDADLDWMAALKHHVYNYRAEQAARGRRR
ncbi:MAG: hypothetical protein AAFQ98_08900 [Bacteroidota bacterium]